MLKVRATTNSTVGPGFLKPSEAPRAVAQTASNTPETINTSQATRSTSTRRLLFPGYVAPARDGPGSGPLLPPARADPQRRGCPPGRDLPPLRRGPDVAAAGAPGRGGERVWSGTAGAGSPARPPPRPGLRAGRA